MSRIFEPETMTSDERSFLVYAETQCVDAGGLLEGIRMNAADHIAAAAMVEAGLMRFGRMPARLLGHENGPLRTHWCELTESGWALASRLRQILASRRGPLATEAFAEVAAREAEGA